MKNKNFIVGLFVSFAAIGLFFFVVTTFVKSDFFTDWFFAYTKIEDSFGLKSGNDVTIRGRKVGYIKKLYLLEDHVLVEMKINEKYQHIISKNCTAELLQKNFVVGDWWISLKQTSMDKHIISHNDTLKSDLPIHINKTVSKSTKMVDTVEKIFQHIISGKGALGQLYVDDTLITVAQSLGYNTEQLLKRSDKLFQSAENTLTNVDTLLIGLSATTIKGNNVIDSVAILTAHLTNSIKSANELVKELTNTPKDVNRLVKDLDSVVFEMDTVFRALENHWLLKGSVKELREEE